MGMIEKVAKAMASAESGPEGSALFSVHWDEFGDGYMDSARVAIEAMREPTEEMELAGSIHPHAASHECWCAMIDAALAEERT